MVHHATACAPTAASCLRLSRDASLHYARRVDLRADLWTWQTGPPRGPAGPSIHGGDLLADRDFILDVARVLEPRAPMSYAGRLVAVAREEERPCGRESSSCSREVTVVDVTGDGVVERSEEPPTKRARACARDLGIRAVAAFARCSSESLV